MARAETAAEDAAADCAPLTEVVPAKLAAQQRTAKTHRRVYYRRRMKKKMPDTQSDIARFLIMVLNFNAAYASAPFSVF